MGNRGRIPIRKVIINNGGIMKKVIITLEFDHEDTTREEIKAYLKDLIEDDSLNYEEVE
jgi:short-subunit dehydrogenase involved in D-alanine esterification of teichoic acids|tara:strand:- start:132 stop:308 length:177 start_codon:yes stop_codon:yes gene_type:complete